VTIQRPKTCHIGTFLKKHVKKGLTRFPRRDLKGLSKQQTAKRNIPMIAYFHKAPGKGKFELTICAAPCDGTDFQASERILVAGKREAIAICKARGIKPWNF
jgi:hypothetical protein